MLDLPNPAANESASARDIAYHMHPFTNMRRLESEGPFVITRGQGIHVYDEAGHDYIDAMAGLWCASLGFSGWRTRRIGRCWSCPMLPPSGSARTRR